MSRTVIEELVTVLGFELDGAGLHRALESYTDLHNLVGDVVKLAGELGHAILEPIEKVVELGSEAVRMSRRLGTSVEGIQELTQAAKLAGISTEALTHGLDHLNRTAYEAGTHKEIAQAYGRLGVTLHDTNGKLKTSDVLLGDIAEQLQKDPSKRALLFQVMGRGAGEMIPLLVQGRDKLDELRQIARDSGKILSEETAFAAKDLGFSFQLLRLAADGLTMRLGAGLIPIAGRVVATMTALWKANRAIVVQRLDQFIDLITRAVNPFYQALRVVWSVLTTVVDLFGGWQNVIIALAAVIGFNLLTVIGKFALSIGEATSSLVRFFAVMFAGGLIPALVGAAFIALIAIIAIVIQDLNSTDSSIRKLMDEGDNPEDTNVVRWLKTIINFARAVKDTVGGAIEVVEGLVDAGLSFVQGSGAEGSKQIIRRGIARVTGEAIPPLAGIRAAGAAPSATDFGGAQYGPTVAAAQQLGITVNQTFNGPADPAAVKNASEQGVQRGARDLSEEQRKQTYNSGGRAGYR